MIYVADRSLRTVVNFIGGQKEIATDSINVNYPRDFQHDVEGDIAMAQAGFPAPDQHGPLIEKRGIEVGNIFQLGYHYSSLMANAKFVDRDGQLRPYYMGCYGIGLGRTLATIVEKHHDPQGIVWPKAVAPFLVHLISLTDGEPTAQKLYDQLIQKGVEVLWDDRQESPGVKLTDADLIGIPVRLVCSAKTQHQVEWKNRHQTSTRLYEIDEVLAKLHQLRSV